MTLREKCEHIARRRLGPAYDRSATFDCTYGSVLADDIERVAREFAEQALSSYVMLGFVSRGMTVKQAREAAIAAAERGE